MRLIKLVATVAVIFSISIVTFAHPGKTDSKGGHTEHSTGEYHYHHGYSAHQHYDQDGDGSLDCPYNFTNKTESSNRANSPTKETYYDNLGPDKSTQSKTEETKSFSKKVQYVLELGQVVVFYLAIMLGFVILKFVFKIIKKVIQRIFGI